MSKLPVIAICGRPNVGKSTLFNRISGRMISIEDPTSGVTRDRVPAIVKVGDHYFELLDTGGIGIVDNQHLEKQIEKQINVAITSADLILFLVDIREGITPLDIRVADILRRSKRYEQVWLIANKADNYKWEMEKDIFMKLGFGEPTCISAKELSGIETLKERIEEFLKPFPIVEPNTVLMKIAVVGRANSGKSTFINSLANEERMIVSEQAGTTRDSVDVYFERDGLSFMAIDTAGIKLKKNISENIEYYSQCRAERSIRRADVVLLIIDACNEIGRVEKDLARYIEEQNKTVIIIINKWDLVSREIPTERYQVYVDDQLPGLRHAPICFTSAKEDKNVTATIHLAKSLYNQASRRVGTGELNRAVRKMFLRRNPEYIQGLQGRVYFATQADILPPTFVFFVNNPKLFTPAYQRYLTNQMRKLLDFPEVPLKLVFRNRNEAVKDNKMDVELPSQDLTVNEKYASKEHVRGAEIPENPENEKEHYIPFGQDSIPEDSDPMKKQIASDKNKKLPKKEDSEKENDLFAAQEPNETENDLFAAQEPNQADKDTSTPKTNKDTSTPKATKKNKQNNSVDDVSKKADYDRYEDYVDDEDFANNGNETYDHKDDHYDDEDDYDDFLDEDDYDDEDEDEENYNDDNEDEDEEDEDEEDDENDVADKKQPDLGADNDDEFQPDDADADDEFQPDDADADDEFQPDDTESSDSHARKNTYANKKSPSKIDVRKGSSQTSKNKKQNQTHTSSSKKQPSIQSNQQGNSQKHRQASPSSAISQNKQEKTNTKKHASNPETQSLKDGALQEPKHASNPETQSPKDGALQEPNRRISQSSQQKKSEQSKHETKHQPNVEGKDKKQE